MDSAFLLHLFAMAALVALKIAAPMLVVAIAIGLVVSLFQALTQINESTLAFLPKLIGVCLAGWFAMPWMIQELVSFTVQVFQWMVEVAR